MNTQDYNIDDIICEDFNEEDKICVTVYQIEDTRNCNYAFMSFSIAKSNGFNLDDYSVVATVCISKEKTKGKSVDEILDMVFVYGNTDGRYYADNPKARSISVSDILEIEGNKYYVDSFGFVDIDGREEITEAKEPDSNEEPDSDEEVNHNMAELDDSDEDYDKTALDYLDELQDRQISVAELNVVLQSIFGRFNDIFLIESDLYNADLDETQVLEIWDDDDLYSIYYDIIDVQEGIVEITKSTLE